jgi:hypothetical protein
MTQPIVYFSISNKRPKFLILGGKVTFRFYAQVALGDGQWHAAVLVGPEIVPLNQPIEDSKTVKVNRARTHLITRRIAFWTRRIAFWK